MLFLSRFVPESLCVKYDCRTFCQVVCQCVLVSCKQWFVGCCFRVLPSSRGKVSYRSPLVNWMLVFCSFKCSWNLSILLSCTAVIVSYIRPNDSSNNSYSTTASIYQRHLRNHSTHTTTLQHSTCTQTHLHFTTLTHSF